MNDPTPETESKEQFPEYVLLLKLMHKLLRYKYRIAIIAILGAGLVLAASFLITDRYSSQATVAINFSETPGGIKPNNYRGSNTIGVLEYDFIIDSTQSNEKERYLARMESFGFVSSFINEQNLLPWLYASDWNESKKVWKESIAPDMREAVKRFKSGSFYIDVDKKTDLLNVRITTETPQMSAFLANEYVKSFNTYIRDLESNELKSRRNYLEKRLKEVTNTELHRSIYRLLEAQLAVESLIFARANYPLEMIQPATEPLFESYPNRKKWTALTLIGLLFFGIFTVIFVQIISSFRTDLKAYNDIHFPQSGFNTDQDNLDREGWVDERIPPVIDKKE